MMILPMLAMLASAAPAALPPGKMSQDGQAHISAMPSPADTKPAAGAAIDGAQTMTDAAAGPMARSKMMKMTTRDIMMPGAGAPPPQ